jgi:hypothetical protein
MLRSREVFTHDDSIDELVMNLFLEEASSKYIYTNLVLEKLEFDTR